MPAVQLHTRYKFIIVSVPLIVNFFFCHIIDFFCYCEQQLPSLSFGQIVSNMVTKHAVPPITLEIGSAQNTPSVLRFPIIGSSMVNGMTMMTFRNREKKTACFARFNATAVDCPANCSAIIKIPQK